MKINLVKGVKKRESCFFYRRDTIGGVYRTPVCEKCNFKKPNVTKCAECTVYAPYLSMNDLATREIERYRFFSQNSVSKSESEPIVTEEIVTNNSANSIVGIKSAKQSDAKVNCERQTASLISFIENKEITTGKREVQMKLRPFQEQNSKCSMKEGKI
jgi:hypothetical protein